MHCGSGDGTIKRQLVEQALAAGQSRDVEDGFIAQNKRFILRCASKHTNKFVTDSDDEWSVAMIAFSEALRHYDLEKGPFLPFADLVIARRLKDHLRSNLRFASEISVSPFVFEGQADDEAEDAPLQAVVLSKIVCVEKHTIKYEIEAVSALLSEYGISFKDLAACSPKAGNTRTSCAVAISYVLSTPLIMTEMHCSRLLPIKAVSRGSGVAPKILERHRKYIIAASEILNGDYPNLAEYFSFSGTEKSTGASG